MFVSDGDERHPYSLPACHLLLQMRLSEIEENCRQKNTKSVVTCSGSRPVRNSTSPPLVILFHNSSKVIQTCIDFKRKEKKLICLTKADGSSSEWPLNQQEIWTEKKALERKQRPDLILPLNTRVHVHNINNEILWKLCFILF